MVGTNPQDVASARSEAETDALQAQVEEAGSELARFEDLLASRARALSEAQRESYRLRALVRDTVMRLERSAAEAGGGAAGAEAGAELEAARRERQHAVARALEAEARCAEISFRLDEVLGHLAQPPTAAWSELELRCAHLSGVSRGLRAALAEAEEARDTIAARLLLSQQDALEARTQTDKLQHQLEEAREAFELEQVRLRSLQAAAQGGANSLRAELTGLRARCDEAEAALAASSLGVVDLRAACAQRDAQLEELRAEILSLQSQQGAVESRLGDLDRALLHESERAREYSSTAEDQEAELQRTRELVDRLRRESEEIRGLLDQASSDRLRAREALEVERVAAQRYREEHNAELTALRGTLRDTKRLLASLVQSVDDISPAELPRPPGEGGEATLPGMPIEVEPSEGLERADMNEREEEITRLQGQLSRVEAKLRALRETADHVPPTLAQLDQILSLCSTEE